MDYYNSNSSARPGGFNGGGGIGNNGRVPRLGSGSGARPPRLLSRQEEVLSGGEGCLHLCLDCAVPVSINSKAVCAPFIDILVGYFMVAGLRWAFFLVFVGHRRVS